MTEVNCSIQFLPVSLYFHNQIVIKFLNPCVPKVAPVLSILLGTVDLFRDPRRNERRDAEKCLGTRHGPFCFPHKPFF